MPDPVRTFGYRHPCLFMPLITSAARDQGWQPTFAGGHAGAAGRVPVTAGGWCWSCYRYTWGCLHP